MASFGHSCVLFLDALGESMEFYMRPCSDPDVPRMIEHGGGTFSSIRGPNVIHLVETQSKVVNIIDGESVVSIQYIYDCVKENVKLDISPYLLQIKSEVTSDISEDDDNNLNINQQISTGPYTRYEDERLMEFFLENESTYLGMPFVEFMKLLVKKNILQRNFESLCCRFRRIKRQIKKYEETLLGKRFSRLLSRRPRVQKYSKKEDMKILKYICKKKLYSQIRSSMLFDHMVKHKVTNYSRREMEKRFHRYIMTNLDQYDIPENEKKLLVAAGRLDSVQKRRGKEELSSSDESDVELPNNDESRNSEEEQVFVKMEEDIESDSASKSPPNENRSLHNLPNTSISQQDDTAKESRPSTKFKITSVFTLNLKPTSTYETVAEDHRESEEIDVEDNGEENDDEMTVMPQNIDDQNKCINGLNENFNNATGPSEASNEERGPSSPEHAEKNVKHLKMYDPDMYASLSFTEALDNMAQLASTLLVPQPVCFVGKALNLPELSYLNGHEDSELNNEQESEAETPDLEPYEVIIQPSSVRSINSSDFSMLNAVEKCSIIENKETGLEVNDGTINGDTVTKEPAVTESEYETCSSSHEQTGSELSADETDDVMSQTVIEVNKVDTPSDMLGSNEMDFITNHFIQNGCDIPIDEQTNFLTEITNIVFKLERAISTLDGIDIPSVKNNLHGYIQDFKLRLCRQLLSKRVEQILKKPRLSLADKALLTKYLAQMEKTTPESLLQNLIAST